MTPRAASRARAGGTAMDQAWSRRDVVRGLAGLVAIAAVALAGRAAAAAGRAAAAAGPAAAAPRDREARRRWALARMDEMGLERQRCRERFRDSRQKRLACEAEFERRHRAFNEIYIEAARE